MHEPFTYAVPQADLDDLHARLRATRIARSLGTDERRGMSPAVTEQLLARWVHHYDWRTWETWLNSFPHYRTSWEGHPFHYVHLRSSRPDAEPLLMMHGWPTFYGEFLETARELTEPTSPDDPAFHVVVPSMPGFLPLDDGVHEMTMADRVDAVGALMTDLGYERFHAQAIGFNWGSLVARTLSYRDDRLLSYLTNSLPEGVPTDPAGLPDGLSPERRAQHLRSIETLEHLSQWEEAPSFVMATCPQTLGYALADSPVAQLTWIVDRFLAHPRHRHVLDPGFNTDLLLTHVTSSFLTQSGVTTSDIYFQFGLTGSPDVGPLRVPVGIHDFPDISVRPVREFLEEHYDIAYWGEPSAGGNYPGFEVPELLAAEIRAFRRALRDREERVPDMSSRHAVL